METRSAGHTKASRASVAFRSLCRKRIISPKLPACACVCASERSSCPLSPRLEKSKTMASFTIASASVACSLSSAATLRTKSRRATSSAARKNGARVNRQVVRAEGSAEEAEKCSGSCDSCGLAKDKMECDGTGRIMGGMGAIPLFGWWPIKCYRPCPGLIESGGVYVRKGQDVNAILWGEKGK